MAGRTRAGAGTGAGGGGGGGGGATGVFSRRRSGSPASQGVAGLDGKIVLSLHGDDAGLTVTKVNLILIVLSILLPPQILLGFGVVMTLQDFLLQSAGTFLENGQELSCQGLYLF